MISTPQTEEVLNFNGHEFVFGRNSDVTVFINDPNFSRSHFKIFSENKSLHIIDLGSSNGTYIDGEKIEANKASPITLDSLISVANSSTEIKIIKFSFLEEDVTEIGQEDDDHSNSDLTQFSRKLFDAAHLKVEQMINAATEEANEIVKRGHEKIEKDHHDALKKSHKIISEKEEQAKVRLEEFLLESKNAIQKKLDLDLKLKQEELNEFYKNEHDKLVKRIGDEVRDFEEKNNQEKQKLNDGLKELESATRNQQKELDEIKRIYQERADEMDKELEAKIQNKKEAIKELENDFEEQKKSQLQRLEVQFENRKFELDEKVAEIERKLTSSQKDFSELYENYKVKKEEQTQTIEELSRKKNKLLEDIKNLEERFVTTKAHNDEKMSSDAAFIATLGQELEKAKKAKNEADLVLNKQKESSQELQKSLDDLKAQIKSEDSSLKAKKANIQKIDSEILNKNKEKEDISAETAQLNNELLLVRKKLQMGAQEASKLEEENKAKVTILKNEFLQNKAALQEEMRKLKESEEKRLQDLTLQELNQINKIKEDSLRIVLDLENSITKEICMGSSKVFAATIGVEKYREVSTEFEKSVRASLKKGVLSLLQNELSPVDTSKDSSLTIKKKKMWKSFGYGVAVSTVLFGSFFFIYERIKYENDPIRKQLEAQAREAAKVPVRKFTPVKTAKLGATFVDSVIYTEGFHETYSKESFRSELMKKGSTYLYKKWQIDEEKSIQSYAMIFSMIDTLKARAEKIDPDYEKRDIDKMILLEKETMGKLEKILGNEVRLEAALKFQNRFYQDYLAGGGETATENFPGE